MAIVTLGYSAPVYVEIDTETGNILSVDCADTETVGAESLGEPSLVDGEREHYAAAVQVADSQMWPEWKFV